MSTVITTAPVPVEQRSPNAAPTRPPFAGFTTVARRRFSLSAHTPREILVPLLTPILFAAVIAPALAKAMTTGGPIDYLSFVAVGTVGLLVPLSCVLGGIAMIVDRESGAQRDMLAAPIPRSSMVFGNLSVSVVVSSFQVAALMGVAIWRGATFSTRASGILWMVAATLGIAVAMHSFAEILAARIPKQEEYVGVAPAAALVPWFFAGSFFPISAMPSGLTVFAKILPLTHALALMRYGLVDHSGRGLHDIWGMSSVSTMAALSLAVVVAFAGLMLALSVRVFTRAAID